LLSSPPLQRGISRYIKKRRERAGLIQTELAAKVGVSSKSVNCWENGTHIPHPKRAKKLDWVLSQLLRKNEKR